MMARWKTQVLQSHRVQSEIIKLTESKSFTLREANKHANKIVEEMFADIWPNNVRAIAYLFRKVWRQMYEG